MSWINLISTFKIFTVIILSVSQMGYNGGKLKKDK